MSSTLHTVTRRFSVVARGAALFVLLALSLEGSIAAPSVAAHARAAQDTVAHVVRLDGPAIVRIISVIDAKLICHGCLQGGGDVTSPASGSLTYASSGSGAFITPDGYVLTADHVVDHGKTNPEDVDLIEQAAADDIAKQLHNNTDTPASILKFLQDNADLVDIQTTLPFQKVFLSTNYTGTLSSTGGILSYDVTSVAAHSPVTEQDTAIIKVNAQDVPYLSVAPPNSVTVGDSVTAIAFPGDADLALNNADFTTLVDPGQSDLNTINSLLGASVNTGQVTAKKVRSDGTSVYETSGISSQGSSGGPVIDSSGKIIGFVDAGPSTDRLTFLIPSEVIAKYTVQAGIAHPRQGAFMSLWTKANDEYDASTSCHWSNATADLNTLHTRYPNFGAVNQYLSKAQQQATGETCALSTGSGSAAAGLFLVGGCLLLLAIIVVVIIVVIVRLTHRKPPAALPVGVPSGYPMRQQMPLQAGQAPYQGYGGPGGYGQPAAPSMPAMPYQPPQQPYPAQAQAGAYQAPSQTPAQMPPQMPAYQEYAGYAEQGVPATTPFPPQGALPTPAPPYQPSQPGLSPQQPPPQQSAQTNFGSAAGPTTPMRRCLNGHIVSDAAAIFCPECGTAVLPPHQ